MADSGTGSVRLLADARRGAARSLINQPTMRQNCWTLGAACAQRCRVVGHHTIEDQMAFPSLAREEASPRAVLARPGQEREVIAAALDLLGPLGRRAVVA